MRNLSLIKGHYAEVGRNRIAELFAIACMYTVADEQFLQRGRIACNAQRCNTYSNSVCPSVCLSVYLSVCPSVTHWYPTQMNEGTIMQSSL